MIFICFNSNQPESKIPNAVNIYKVIWRDGEYSNILRWNKFIMTT